MDSITQIVLGASVAEAAAGKQMGNKAAMWGAIAGTIPDLDVILRAMSNPIDGALLHRGFSHSIVFALIASPILAWLVNRLYKRKFEYKLWLRLFFLAIITHPMLDIFTNYGTQFFWPFDLRVTFNSVFVIDPLYTVPFGILLLIALFLKRESKLRSRLNYAGIIYSTFYLLWCSSVKLVILNKADDYFSKAGIHGKNNLVTPMPFTSFYWMMITEDSETFYVGYKSLFYDFKPEDIDIVEKKRGILDSLRWKGTDQSDKLRFISNGYYALEDFGDTVAFYDLRFGMTSKATNEKICTPMMGYGMVIDRGFVNKTFSLRPKQLGRNINFKAYFNKVFKE